VLEDLTRLATDDSQCTNSPSLPIPKDFQIPYLPPNLALPATLAYCILYILLEPVAGSVLSVVLLSGTAYANTLTSKHNPEASYYAIGAHIFAWIAQFIGHGVFEGRAPALLDNLFQAIFLAPLFVWLEILFAFGYRPELKKRLEKGVKQDVEKFRNERNLIIAGEGANGGPLTRSRATNGKAKSG
jgi:uncharacterized membrane protein YGL010W